MGRVPLQSFAALNIPEVANMYQKRVPCPATHTAPLLALNVGYRERKASFLTDMATPFGGVLRFCSINEEYPCAPSSHQSAEAE